MKQAVFFVPYILFSVYISFLDIKTGGVPRMLLWGAIIIALLYKTVTGGNFVPFGPLLGGMAGTGIFLLVYAVSGKRLGLADVWYAGLIGVVLGPFLLYASFGVSCVLSIVFVLLTKKKLFPFIPFMSAGSFMALPFLWTNN